MDGPLSRIPDAVEAGRRQAVVAAILDAKDNPIKRPVDAAKLARRPRALKAAIGPVTVPDSEESSEESELPQEEETATKEPTAHTEIQWSLLKLGNDMGLDIWVARNDRNRDWRGHRISLYLVAPASAAARS